MWTFNDKEVLKLTTKKKGCGGSSCGGGGSCGNR